MSLTPVAVNHAPAVQSFLANPVSPITVGQVVTLTATATDPDAGDDVVLVRFFDDINGDGSHDFLTEQLGADYDRSDGWSFSWDTSGHSAGIVSLLAVAYDQDNAFSIPYAISVAVLVPGAHVQFVGNPNFGWVHETLAGPTQTFTVRNVGTDVLTLSNLQLPDGFSLVPGEQLAPSLDSLASDSITVRLDTQFRGIKAGNITFATNDPDEDPFTFAITGTVGPVAAPFNLSAAATSATSVQLAWQDPNGAADRFTIDSKTDGFRDPWSTPEELPGGTTAWQATGLVPFVAYRYRLIGYSATGNPGTDEIKVMFDGDGNCWTLGKDHRLLRNGVLVRGDTEDFLVTSDGYLYWLGTGGVFERRPIGGGAWERLDDDAVRFQVVDGVAYSVGADKWLNRNGVPMWTNTLDYYIMPEDTPSSPLGTVYWHGFYGSCPGILQRLLPGRTTWQDLDCDAMRYEIDANGVCYSIGRDGWLNRLWDRQWQNTRDYVIEAHTNPALNNTIYWLGTSGIFQRLRPGTTVWQDLDQDAVSFTIDDGGIAYSVGRDYWLNREGVPMWHKTRAFRILADRSIYWFGWDNTYAGIVERLPYQAFGWQRLDVDATKVAIRDAWVAYSLGKDKRVNYEGTPTWDNVDDMFIDVDGCLVMKRLPGDVRLTDSFFEML